MKLLKEDKLLDNKRAADFDVEGKTLITVSAARRRSRRTFASYLYLAPYLVLFILFMLAPAVFGVLISFTNWDILGAPSWIGLENYRNIFADGLFRRSIWNTFYFFVLTAAPLVALGLALAILLNQNLRGRAVARTIVFLPHVLMISAVGIIWVWILDTNWGLLNFYLIKLGIPQIGWLTDTSWSMPALALTTIWWTVNTNMIIYLAGLQDIPDELYDASKLDGANAWAQFRFITFPMLRPINAFVIPLTIIASWRVFGQSYIMTNGGPEASTFVMAQYIYLEAFQNFQMGPASAAAVVLLLITLAFTLTLLRAMRINEELL